MYKLEESTETTVVFDNYTDELEYSLKTRKIRWGWIDGFFTKTYCLKWVKKSPKVKIIKSSCQTSKTNLSYWKNSPNILHITHENTRKDLMGHTTLNIEKDTVLISQSQKQSLFSSNQKETHTRIALHCSESSKPVLVKAKDTDILILMVYAFALTSQSYDWYLQIDNRKIVSIKKHIKILEKQLVLCLPQFLSLTGCDTASHLFWISKTCFPTIVEGYICYIISLKNLANQLLLVKTYYTR